MQDFKERLEQLATDAAECDLIAALAVDKHKREIFSDLGRQYRKMAAAIREVTGQEAASDRYRRRDDITAARLPLM